LQRRAPGERSACSGRARVSDVRISIVRPPGCLHSEAVREVAESLHYACLRLGHRSAIVENRYDGAAKVILLAANLIPPEDVDRVPPSAIVYNLEQISGRLAHDNPSYAALLARCEVWDYSRRNLDALTQLGVRNAAHLPIGFVPELARFAPAETEDIDVLFYGSVNERRDRILKEIRNAGVVLHVAFGRYGPERDALIARAKVVLNLHSYDTRILEMTRISYALANRKAVLSEHAAGSEVDADLREAIAFAEAPRLADACVELAFDDHRRRALAERGFAHFSARSLPELLRERLGAATPAGAAAGPPRYPLRLNLGSGRDWREDWLNVGIGPEGRPDAVLDIAAALELPRFVATERFGTIALHEHLFDEIVANDVLEHLPDLVAAMTNCLRLLKIGGLLRIQVPYGLSEGARQDPTHVRGFDERSWSPFTEGFWHAGWRDYRFEVAGLAYVLSPMGEERQRSGVAQEEILRTPRAVDVMRVALRKRMLTGAERALERKMRGGRAATTSP